MEKVNGKEAGSSPLPALTGTESRAVRKFMELEAGRVLMEQAAKRAEEEREKLEEERQETKEQESGRISRDTPELSRQSRWFGLEGKLLEEEQLKWLLEMEQEPWEALQSWKPIPYVELAKQLEELSKLYLKLLEAVLTCTTGENQNIQKGRLDGVLTEKLQLLAEVRLKNLIGLLERTGDTETLKRVWYSLYKQTAGDHISVKRAVQLSTDGYRGPAVEGRVLSVSMEEGSVYKHSGGNGVRMSAEFDIHRKADAADSLTSDTGRGNGQGIFTGEELERAEAFASHLQESGSLFEGLGRADGSAEAAGYFAALTSIKGQMYSEENGRAGTAAFPMENIINRMVDYYLGRKEAYQVYYYTMDMYEKTKEPQKAAEKGLEYAWRMFQEKKQENHDARRSSGGEQTGFFQMLSGETAEEAYKRGLRLLEKNWREFLNVIGQEGKNLTLRAQRYSAWGAMVEAEERRRGREERENRLLLRQLAAVAGIVLIYLAWRFLFS